MAKLTKAELARRTITEDLLEISQDSSYSLDDIVAQHGGGLTIYWDGGYYDDPGTVWIRRVREEADEEYDARIELARERERNHEARLRDARKKRDADERATYERLRKKFGGEGA